FFFQAEDGIRDFHVTGVQTCALPISVLHCRDVLPDSIPDLGVRTRMARSKTSAEWLKEHVDDIYVQKAQQDGYRTRASYKLLELDEKDQLIKPGMVILDIGAAPGGWSQVVGRKLNGNGVIIASDILSMDPIADVDFIQG